MPGPSVVTQNPHSPRGIGGENNSLEDYNPLWISELRRTDAFEVWDRVTDPLLFDIAEPRWGDLSCFTSCAGKIETNLSNCMILFLGIRVQG